MAGPHRILISDPLAPEVVDRFGRSGDIELDMNTGIDPAELPEVLRQYHGLVVRSGTRVTREVLARPGRLRQWWDRVSERRTTTGPGRPRNRELEAPDDIEFDVLRPR